MSIDTVPSTATAPTGPASAGRGRERAVFVAAVAVGLLHAVDEAVLHRQPGVPVGRHLPALLAVTLAAMVAAAVFSRLRPGLRSALALVAGAFGRADGALHVIGVAAVGIQRSDVTGLLAAVAGLVLLALGAMIPLRHRGEVP